MQIKLKIMLLLLAALLLAGCAKPRPDNVENICDIFYQYPDWYWDAKRSEQKWGVSVPIQMAVIYQESSFNARAKPPRKWFLGIIPGKRPSTAYGYSQALDGTWADYKRITGNSGSRTDFGDATDFIGWYTVQARKRAGISLTNPYQIYIAYHDGAGGYMNGTHLKKPWLIKTAHKVSHRSKNYERQLERCEGNIQKPGWFW